MFSEIGGKLIGAATNHLWQSTVFAVVAGLLTLAFRKNRAQVRYWLWLSASLKFLVPFALLMGLGSGLWDALAAMKPLTEIAPPDFSFTVAEIAQPFPNTLSFAPGASHTASWPTAAVPLMIFIVWLCGCAVIALMRVKSWLRIRAAVRAGTPVFVTGAGGNSFRRHSEERGDEESLFLSRPARGGIPRCARNDGQKTPRIRVVSAPGLLEPGVVGLDVPGLAALGLTRPILLLPAGIVERLTAAQLEAVLAHELSHVRRRDNLTAALHMIVEAMFWSHPLVWWIGARLVEERERACDEEVLRLGNEPEVYAESILQVCKFYAESPLVCVSGVTGSDIKRRMERIMKNQTGEGLNRWRKLFLATAGMAALAMPIAAGVFTAPRLQAQSSLAHARPADTPKWDVVSIKPCTPASLPSAFGGGARGGNGGPGGGPPTTFDPDRMTLGCQSVALLIRDAYVLFANGVTGQSLTAVNAAMRAPVEGGQDWINSKRYSIEAKTEGTAEQEMMRGPCSKPSSKTVSS